jgi:predicted phosphodiesterase
MKEFNIKIDAPQNAFQLMVLGDMHIGDELCDLELIKSTIDYIKKTKYCYCILNGDLINNALKTSKSDTYKEQMTMEEEQDLLIELLTPIKNKILVMATGNHEHRTTLLAGINPLKAVAYALGIKDKLVDHSYVLTLEFGVAHGMKNLSNKYVVYGIHGGSGGGRRAGATANALQDMSLVIPNVDLYIHSHTHTTINYNDMVFLYDSKTKKLKEHQRTYYNANAFLKYGGYAEQKGYKPADRQPSVLVVNAIRKNGEMKMKTDIVRI